MIRLYKNRDDIKVRDDMKKVFQYAEYQGLPLDISYYPAKAQPDIKSRPAIIYFHGGGFIFGQRDDLPIPYIELLTANGYPLVTVDYPLAPEAKLRDIFQALTEFFAWFDLHYADKLKLFNTDKILFGRSAGAYLALMWAKRLPVKAVISFYGYYTFFHNHFTEASPYFSKYPAVPAEHALSIIQAQPMVSSTIEARYLLYLYYRQSGSWPKALLAESENLDAYSIKVAELAQLPATFLAASRTDEDVPFFLSKLLDKNIPQTQFIQLDDLPHDFDRDPNLPTSIPTYRSLLAWLNDLD